MFERTRSAMMAALLVLVGAGEAQADELGAEFTLTGHSVTVKTAAGTREVPLPDCDPKAVQRDGTTGRVYVACGASGILVLDATDPAAPVVRSRISTDGEAVGFHSAKGRLWVELAHVEAHAVDALARSARPIDGGRRPTPEAAPSAPLPPPTEAPPATAPPATAPPAQPRPDIVTPRRRAGIWEVAANTRVFLPIGNLGFGALNALAVTHRLEAPVAIHAEVSPLGIAAAKQGTIGTVAAHAIVAFDIHLFEAGLGVGAATLNEPHSTKDTSVSFAQFARFGARDGLALQLRSNIVVDRDEFELGSFAADGQIPLAARWSAIVAGGGGPIGFAYGDVGVRYLLLGDLGPGSLLFSGTVGGTTIFKKRACVSAACTGLHAEYAGPSLGVGLEWRL